MKKYFLLILSVIAFGSAFSQTGNDTTKYTYFKFEYGQKFNRIWGLNVVDIPTDTTYSKYGIARKGLNIFVGNGTVWANVTGSGSPGVTSFNTRTGAVTSLSSDYSAYFPLLSGAYNDPSWINTLSASKISSAGSVSAGSSKITLGGTPVGASLQNFSIDVNQANLNLASIGGALGISQISATGTPSSSTFLRGDGTWNTATGGGIAAPTNTGASGLRIYYAPGNNIKSIVPGAYLLGDSTTNAGSITLFSDTGAGKLATKTDLNSYFKTTQLHGTKGNMLYYAPDGSAYTTGIKYDSTGGSFSTPSYRVQNNGGLQIDTATNGLNSSFFSVKIGNLNGSAAFQTGGTASSSSPYTAVSNGISAAAGLYGFISSNSSTLSTAFSANYLATQTTASDPYSQYVQTNRSVNGGAGQSSYYSGITTLSAGNTQRFFIDYDTANFGTTGYASRTHLFQADSIGNWYKPIANLVSLDSTNNKIVVRNTTTGKLTESYWPTFGSGGGTDSAVNANSYLIKSVSGTTITIGADTSAGKLATKTDLYNNVAYLVSGLHLGSVNPDSIYLGTTPTSPLLQDVHFSGSNNFNMSFDSMKLYYRPVASTIQNLDTTNRKVLTWNPTTKQIDVTYWQVPGTGGSTLATASGDATGTVSGTNLPLTLATVNSNTGSFGDATHVPQVTLNGKGLVTAASSVAITGLISSLTTTGTSGAATYSAGTLNIPQYAGGGSSLSNQNITTGSSATVTGGQYIVTFNPSSAISTYTLTLPASPSNNDIIIIRAGGTISAGTVVSSFTLTPNTGQTITDPNLPNLLIAGQSYRLRWSSTYSTYYPENN